MAAIGVAGTAVLALRDCSFSYQREAVLDRIQMELRSAEVLALLGPNGAGKSTLIRCICGRLSPDQGQVRVAGQDPRHSPDARAAIGLVPQQLALYSFLTVRENLAAFAALAGMKRSGRNLAVDRTLRQCNLSDVADRQSATLSGGWQRRLNIACAIVHQPRLLVLDEPTVGVDPPARAQIEALLQGLAAAGMAILITSHELDQLERLASRVAFLRAGRIVADDAPQRLLDQSFGSRRECRIAFRREPDALLCGRLVAWGLEPQGGERVRWAGRVDDATARALSSEFAGSSEVERLQLQRPGLAALWREIYGTEAERAA